MPSPTSASEPTIERTWWCRKERAEASIADLVAVALDVEPVERLHRRFRLAFGGAEGREVVLADEPLRRRMHRRGVERARHAPGAAALEREIGAPVDDAIEIMPLRAEKRASKSSAHPLGGQHRDRMRPQMRVERIAHRVGVPVLGEIDMRHLAERMHAGIGAAGALHRDRLAAEGLDRRGQRALHRSAVGLDLPAGERRAVIFDR